MRTKDNSKVINISEIVGRGYGKFWRSKQRYKVIKGSRASKKSTTAALRLMYNLTKYPLANALVIRRVFNTHKDSTWTQLKWAAAKLGILHLWNFSKSPLEVTNKVTGQKILFRGLDDPMSITSITVEYGYLCWAWFEEAYQIQKEDDFNKVDMSIRGQLPHGYWKEIVLTLNPWNDKHWIKKRFFDAVDDDVLAITTNYLVNEFLGSDDIYQFEKMKKNSPRRYEIEGLGNWGVAEGLIFDYELLEFEVEEISKRKSVVSTFGLDFGYTNDPTAFIALLIDKEEKEIYIFDEIYKKAMSNKEIYETIKYKGYAKERIIADSAEPKSIDDLKQQGLKRLKGTKKGAGSILAGIQWIQDYKIYVHPKCVNCQIEFDNYIWNEKNGIIINEPIDEFNHLMDAFRYSIDPIRRKGFNVLK